MNDIEQFGRENLVKIANWYYVSGMTQEQIAVKLNCSRQRINRIIKSLVDLGVVTIQINGGDSGCLALEDALERRFGLCRAVVAGVDAYPEQSSLELCKKGARYLETFIANRQTVGISCGSTLSQLVACMRTQVKSLCQVVQLVGTLNTRRQANVIRPDTTARLLAKKLSCGCSLLYAPGLSSAGREEALSLPDIRRTMDSFATCDIALVGIGRLVPGCAVHKLGAADEGELAQAAQGNCAGEVALNRYTLEGKSLGPAFDRAIGVDMETLKHIPYVIAVAGGLCKADAVLGALRTGCIDVLIVDSLLARKLLEEPGTPGSEADGQHGRCL